MPWGSAILGAAANSALQGLFPGLAPGSTIEYMRDPRTDRYLLQADCGGVHRQVAITPEMAQQIRLDTLYGCIPIAAQHAAHVGMANGYSNYKPPKKFPRSILRRIDRMNRLIRWRRQKLRERHLIHAGIALGVLIAVPLIAVVISAAWQFAIRVILG